MNDTNNFNIAGWWQANAEKEAVYGTLEETEIMNAMRKQVEALKKLGWSDAIYCPKDGSTFLVICAGDGGAFPCYYDGEWPTGSWWISHAGDLWPARPILWHPMREPAQEAQA